MLAMVVNDDAYLLSKCGVLEAIASKPAPTLEQHCSGSRAPLD